MNGLAGNYERAKEKLLELDAFVIEGGFLPSTRGKKEYTREDIEALEEKLNKNEFIVCVCGQINAGKTTFLNALLFQEEILPSNVTPNTAKLALLKYGDKREGRAYFYTEEEWARLQEERYYEKYIRSDVEHSFNQYRVRSTDVIKKYRNRKQINDFKKLHDFVASKGKYTPFVNYIELCVPLPILRGCTVVDTPGLNDPNIIRSQVTEDWIVSSDAVVYITHSKGMDRYDEEFIDTYLRFVSKDRIIIAINGIDELENMDAVKDFVELNIRHGRLRERDLLDATQKVYPISAVSSLIRSVASKGRKLSKNLQFYRDRIQRKHPEYIEEDGFLPELREAISNYFMKNKGNAVIDHHKNLLEEMCLAKIDNIKSELNTIELEIEHLKGDQEKRKKDIAEIEEARYRLQWLEGDAEDKMEDEVNKFKSEIFEFILQQKHGAMAEFEQECKNIGKDNIDKLENEIPFILKKIVERRFSAKNFRSRIEEEISALKENLNDIKARVEEEVLGRVSHSLRSIWFPTVDTYEVVRKAWREIDKLDQQNFKEAREKFLFWTKKEKTFDNFVRLGKEILDKAGKVVEDIVVGDIPQHFEYASECIAAEVHKKLNELQEKFEELEKGAQEIETSLLNSEKRREVKQKEENSYIEKYKKIEGILREIDGILSESEKA